MQLPSQPSKSARFRKLSVRKWAALVGLRTALFATAVFGDANTDDTTSMATPACHAGSPAGSGTSAVNAGFFFHVSFNAANFSGQKYVYGNGFDTAGQLTHLGHWRGMQCATENVQ